MEKITKRRLKRENMICKICQHEEEDKIKATNIFGWSDDDFELSGC